MTTVTSAKRVHEILSAMAWERVPANASLQFHLAAMSQILGTAELYQELWKRVSQSQRPTIVCLVGSTRFWREYEAANRAETLAGHIVLTVGFFVHAPNYDAEGEMVNVTPEQKAFLDRLHLRKIELADEVLVLNRNGYIGDSTRAEIEYAEKLGKPIRWLETPATEGEA